MADDEAPRQSVKPRWLVYLESQLLADADVDDDERATLAVFRAMLESPADDAAAARSASQQIIHHYQHEFLAKSEQVQSWPDRGVMVFVNEVAGLALELAAEVPFPSPEHQRFARFFVAVRDAGPRAFGVEDQDPAFELYNTAVGTAVERHWNRCQVPGCETDPGFKTRCEASISMAALFAKMLEADILTPRTTQFAAILLGEALGTAGEKGWRPTTQLGRWCRVALAVPYILIAGEAVARQVRSPPAEPPVYPCGGDEWKAWVAGFRDLAETLPEEADWSLKGDTKKAHDRMRELLPELVSE